MKGERDIIYVITLNLSHNGCSSPDFSARGLGSSHGDQAVFDVLRFTVMPLLQQCLHHSAQKYKWVTYRPIVDTSHLQHVTKVSHRKSLVPDRIRTHDLPGQFLRQPHITSRKMFWFKRRGVCKTINDELTK